MVKQKNKKTTKKVDNKLTNKQTLKKEETKLNLLKYSLEHYKNVYEMYIKALVKYSIEDLAYSAVYFEELYNKELSIKIERMENSKDDKEFSEWLFGGDPNSLEEDKIKSEIEYYNKLIDYAKNHIKNTPDDKKVKIAKDAIEYGYKWLKLTADNSKVRINKQKNKKIKNGK